MTHWMNQLINDEAVYRTAPATPGLLIISDEAVILKWKLLDFDINFGIWLFNFYIRQQEDEEEEDEGEEEEKEEEVRDRNNTDGN